MIKVICCLRDKKANYYGDPLVFPNIELAKRSIKEFIEFNPEETPAIFPEDFAMYQLGTVDDSNGVITPISPIVVLELVEITD